MADKENAHVQLVFKMAAMKPKQIEGVVIDGIDSFLITEILLCAPSQINSLIKRYHSFGVSLPVKLNKKNP